MNIAISGASGFIGSYLSSFFKERGYMVKPLTRDVIKDKNKLREALYNCEVIINLAGVTINHRWTKAYKQELINSRILTTKMIADAINKLDIKPKLFISVSAVGIYPSEGCYDDYSILTGNDFLSQLCSEWERESHIVNKVRVVNPRFGVVFSKDGGAFPKMVHPARLGIATIIGNGQQSISWIDIDDLARAMEFIIHKTSVKDAVNFVSPNSISNKEFTEVISEHYHSMFTVRIPSLILRMVMGEASDFVIKGQNIKPAKLTDAGFVFKSSTLKEFLHF